jgi:tryptophan halogenase
MTANKRSVENYVILGGGTAGLLTALYVRQVLPTKNVIIVKSDEIGVIGAGEGTTPIFIDLLDFLNIPVSRLVQKTGATLKNGINFKGWSKDLPKENYLHPFNADFGAGISSLESYEHINGVHPGFLVARDAGDSLSAADLTSMLVEGHQIAAIDEGIVIQNADPINNYTHMVQFALHFDAIALSKELLAIAKSRKIKVVEGIVSSYERDDSGDVKKLILEDSTEVESDFIFDASGFKRFFAKELKSKWISHKEHLPVDAAIPFFLPATEKISAVTDAIAMKYGWMWKIPLQHRYGCGYAFDSSLITAQEAQAEVEEYLGHDIDVNRTLSFEPGYYEDPWKNNVISVGLSAGFIEPLEATSITSLIMQLRDVLPFTETMSSMNPKVAELYNNKFATRSEEIAALVNFHYLTDRDDTEFWRKFSRKTVVPSLSVKLDVMDARVLHYSDVAHPFWSPVSWYYVAFGVKYQPLLDSIDAALDSGIFTKFHSNEYKELKGTIESLKSHCIDHRTYLIGLGAKRWTN